jgi:hypothetical protein
MSSWLDRPSSLNWANKKKLSQDINDLEKYVTSLKEKLFFLLSVVNHLETHSKELSELKSQQRLTAKHIVHLRPLLDQSEDLHKALNALCQEKASLSHHDDEAASPHI